MKLAILLAALLLPFRSPAETIAEKRDRMEWFHEARFGMFIHWGVYSVAAGEWNGKPVAGSGEWIQSTGRIPADEYQNTLRSQFNPVKYDPESWVLAAKNAGMKYLVITSKHHDGFCLWDSALTEWDVASTPYGKDLLKPLAEACRRHGMKFCLYHSIMDWHHRDYGNKAAWRGNTRNASPDMDRYALFLKGQLKELLTNYGDVGLLWFDGEWESSWTHERAVDLDAYLRRLQPGIILNNRIDKGRNGMAGLTAGAGFRGDYATPEQQIPATGLGPDISWESCMTMNDSWGYKKSDENWKSPVTLGRNLIDVASKGGNYLLNVGPTAEGEIPAAELECLQKIGAWMKSHGESIHGTTASLFSKYSWDGRSTTRRNADGTTTLYLHLFSPPPNGMLIVRGLETLPVGISILGSAEKVTAYGISGYFVVQLPDGPLDPIATVIALRFADTPVVKEIRMEPDPAGVMQLAPDAANLRGDKIKVERLDGPPNIGYWLSSAEFVFWNVKIPAGKYRIEIEGSCETSGSDMKIQFGATEIPFLFPSTGSWRKYRKIEGGSLNVLTDVAGEFTVRAVSNTGLGFMNIRSIVLTREPE